MCVQEQNESLDHLLSEACGREGREKAQLVLAGATLPKDARLQAYMHKVPACAISLKERESEDRAAHHSFAILMHSFAWDASHSLLFVGVRAVKGTVSICRAI